jgi:hypothetical protein
MRKAKAVNKTKLRKNTNVKKNKKVNNHKVSNHKTKSQNKTVYNYADYCLRHVVNTRKNYFTLCIPSKYIERLGIERGTIMNIREVNGKLVIKKIN